ncbi:HET-domain-containing protein, partial [Stipitochalara longipes BDJ]
MAATRPLQSRADCEANFDLIRFWISQCELHPVCARVPDFASKFQLPTRLIDIGLNSDASPRLILSSDLNESADCRYVTLSHCWGDPSKVPKTVRMTLTQHQKRITGLSKTFEDAIEVTRQIGVRYLWIDSFCIIQQDITDWEIECSRMSLTYARAYCVLSAMDVVEGSDGLFIPRSSLSPPTHIDNVTSWDSASKGPLSTRGWAFQEHQLSTRIIHFTKSRILWECRACVAYEESSVPVPRVLLGKALQVQHDIQTRWLRAVEVYSSRSLTFSDDRLPALSGLASAVSSIMVGNDYLAGIWRDDITRGLLWQRSQALAPITNKLASVPSWSWAS